MLGPVGLHQLLHKLEQRVLVVVGFHIDEVHNHDAAHIPQPQLSGNLFGRNLVHFEGVLLLVGRFGADAAVNVYYV